ncbi:restriction endonuclease [Streptomyces sp. NPDC005780]|uniref:restriction endonuclease n=1 Tax=Streptomyces sp. NPDC005780 TaxID=3364730 RepID=UPI003691C0EA
MAGRREKELVARVPEMAEVARWLRQSRRLSGLTYEDLVQATGFSRGRLHRAAHGWRSAWPVVEAFTRACGTDVAEARDLWLKAKAALEGVDQDPDVIPIGQVGTFEELREAMNRLRALAGSPSLRELEERAGKRLTRSTLSNVLSGMVNPRRDLVVTFAEIVGVSRGEAAAWGAAWERAETNSRAARARTARDLETPAKPLMLVPAPAALAALADIPLAEGAAVAELVDAVMKGSTGTGQPPAVTVGFQHYPASPGHDTITVSCRHTGMDRNTISRAFMTSWTGGTQAQDVFGLSFVMACLHLGAHITLRTARARDRAWTVLTFDLASLTAGSTWHALIGAEPKAAAEDQGIFITLKALRGPWPPGRQNRLRHQLGDIYSYLLRKQQVHLTVSDRPVAPRMPCIWGENRVVQRREGSIAAVQRLDIVMATRYRCRDCQHTSPLGSPHCPQCQGTQLELTEQRVWGWLGVQRYLHSSDYGLDFFRNGRKVLVRDKRLFFFEDGPARSTVEYPVDGPAKGRLVGEIHCDHVPVNFTKTAFDYDSPEWRAVVHAVRGPGPLALRHAQRLGYAPNTSPLATLFGAFRRNDPGLRNLVPGDGTKALHDEAAAWAERFRKGDPAYQSDDKWYEAALAHSTPQPAVVASADDRIDLVSLSPDDLDDLVHRLCMKLHGTAEGPRELIGPGPAATVFRDRPRTGERWVLQCRRNRHVVPAETVHALAGQMLDVQASRGILVTTSWFEAGSHAFAQRSGRIDLVDGRALKALLREHLGIEARLGLGRLPPEWNLHDIA